MEDRALFIGGPCDGQHLETDTKHHFVTVHGCEYRRFTLQGSSTVCHVFAVPSMDLDTVIVALIEGYDSETAGD